jgi:hypothetical protein
MEIVIILWLLAMAFSLWLAASAVKAHSQGAKLRRYYPNEYLPRTTAQPQRKPPKVKRHTTNIKNLRQWREFLTLLQGDEGLAQRLVNAERIRNPSRSEEWCLDKALWQLKRDRR